MRKFMVLGSVAMVTTVILAALFSVSAFAGDSAQEPGPREQQRALKLLERPQMVAIAIGQLNEADGETATVDFRGAIRMDGVGGNLRFFSEEYGYYNGGVRTLSVEEGIIHATGGGGLFQPDGTRIGVRYEAEFVIESGETTIHVMGKDGLDYMMEGTLDGLVHAGPPPAKN